jgi:hypothetical protein
MQTKETKDKGYEAKSTNFRFAPTGRGMCEMMSKSCTGHGGFPDCSAMMTSMMEAARNQPCCTPKKEDTEFSGSKK